MSDRLALFALALLAPVSAAQSPDEWLASSGVLPPEQGPGWTVYTDSPCGATTATLQQGLLTIDTSICREAIHSFGYTRTGSPVPQMPTVWVEAEVRVGTPLPGGVAASIGLTPGLVCPFRLELADGEVRLYRLFQQLAIAPADTTSAVRTWRMELDWTTGLLAVTVDGQPLISLVPPPPAFVCDFVPGFWGAIQFGDLSQAHGGTSEWRAVRHNIDEVWGHLCYFDNPNSTGFWATTTWSGSLAVATNQFTLRTDGLPSGAPGYYLCSQGFQPPMPVTGTQGSLCITGPIGRFVGPGQVVVSSGTGSVTLGVDLTRLPQPNGFVSAATGERWLFQLWYRDANPTPTSNLSSALHVIFQ